MPEASAVKPIDLHPMGELHDARIYRCQFCGDRYHADAVEHFHGGVCPKDGTILRPLGWFERKHNELWPLRWRKSA